MLEDMNFNYVNVYCGEANAKFCGNCFNGTVSGDSMLCRQVASSYQPLFITSHK